METFNRESYVEKVRKLLAKAEGAATEAEAEAFFAKAADLIGKWEIEEAELANAKQAGPASWEIHHRTYPLSSYSHNQDSFAMQCVARAMGLRAYQTPYVRGCQKAETVVFGTEDDLDRYEMMWATVSLQMTRFMKAGENSAWNRNQQRAYRLGSRQASASVSASGSPPPAVRRRPRRSSSLASPRQSSALSPRTCVKAR